MDVAHLSRPRRPRGGDGARGGPSLTVDNYLLQCPKAARVDLSWGVCVAAAAATVCLWHLFERAYEWQV